MLLGVFKSWVFACESIRTLLCLFLLGFCGVFFPYFYFLILWQIGETMYGNYESFRLPAIPEEPPRVWHHGPLGHGVKLLARNRLALFINHTGILDNGYQLSFPACNWLNGGDPPMLP